MSKFKASFYSFILISALVSCKPSEPKNSVAPSKAETTVPKPSPSPSAKPSLGAVQKAYHIKGTIDEASQEGDVCDVTLSFTVPGTLKFEFTPESPTKGKYTYSGPFNATGKGPYEILGNGKMLVSGIGCIMGNHCADYSHHWEATPIDAQNCGKGK